MSIDYPLYEEMSRRRSKAAKWWRTGDILYYVGLLGALLYFLVATFNICSSLFDANFNVFQLFQSILNSLLVVLLFVLIVFLGGCLKRFSYKIAKQEGINPDDY